MTSDRQPSRTVGIGPQPPRPGEGHGDALRSPHGVAEADGEALMRMAAGWSQEWTRDAVDAPAYLAAQVSDVSHRDVLGPLIPAKGGSGVVLHRGRRIAGWGRTADPEMAFSATKSVVSLVAGVAYDDGLLTPEQPVSEVLDLPQLRGRHNEQITWEHLLQQTSQWEGSLWGKPTHADAQSYREGSEVHGTAPGHGWAYNDVRMNLLTLCLTALFGRTLEHVLREAVMRPLGASDTWSWHGYENSHHVVNDLAVPVVSGGAHWGGGLFISAEDLALIGQLYLDAGRWQGSQLISNDWVARSWSPCDVKPEYGYLWWLNDGGAPWPTAPRSGRCARGNGGRHLLWIDPARDLVLCSRWTEHPARILEAVSAVVPVALSEN